MSERRAARSAGGRAADARADPDRSIDGQLEPLRRQIDALDARLLELLSERARVAQRVGEIKQKVDAPVYRPEREAQVLARLRERNPGPLGDDALEAIWRELISACRGLERRLRIAFLGPEGTFSELAVLAHFGSSVEPIACPSIEEVFRSSEAGSTDFGMVPVENSTEGAVNRSLDLMLQTPLRISAEVSVPVRHNLMTQNGSMAGVTRICAHGQALAQCTNWLNQNHPGLERVAVASNAEGARLASEDASIAAIAAERAAMRFGLHIVAPGIQDDPQNRTRFVIVGQQDCEPSGSDQTSLILSVPDRAGAVHALIEPLARHGVSMKRFESRPARQGTWEYYFYIDLIGHRLDPPVKAALGEIRAHAAFFKMLGSYPRAGG